MDVSSKTGCTLGDSTGCLRAASTNMTDVTKPTITEENGIYKVEWAPKNRFAGFYDHVFGNFTFRFQVGDGTNHVSFLGGSVTDNIGLVRIVNADILLLRPGGVHSFYSGQTVEIIIGKQSKIWDFIYGHNRAFASFSSDKIKAQNELLDKLDRIKLPNLPTKANLQEWSETNDEVIEKLDSLQSIVGVMPEFEKMRETHGKIKESIETWKPWAHMMDLVGDNSHELENLIQFYKTNSIVLVEELPRSGV